MSLVLGDNFDYKASKPLDGRLKYDTLAGMKAVADATMYDGCMAYCAGTDKTYQWKSTNTVDETLGRWREFSSGGGGGSSYTAGDGIDITNDVISTKKSQEGDIDEIIDVYPQAGNLVSIVNAFNRGDIYSTEERMIGQWINGKPLYQKSFEFPSTVTITKGSWRDSGVAIQNAEQVLNAFIITNQYHLCAPIQACVSTTLIPSGNIGLYSGKDDDILMDSLTVQYTKTTDTAISIGSTTEYSTDEKVIGTWIDGKPVYQKSIQIANMNSPTGWLTIGTILNIDTLVNGNVVLRDTGDAYAYTNLPICLTISTGLIRFYNGLGGNMGIVYGYATIQYTKTTT